MAMSITGLAGYEAPKHVGVTLSLAHAYYGDDVGADGVYYWDADKGEIACDMADNMFTYRMVRTIDATPEVKALASAWLREKVLGMLDNIVASVNSDRAATIHTGDTVRVVRGRKLPKGTTGKVFWKGETRFGMSIGIALSDAKDASGRHTDVAWSTPGNVELVNAPTLTLTSAQVEDICAKCARIEVYGEDTGIYRVAGLRPAVTAMVERFLGQTS